MNNRFEIGMLGEDLACEYLRKNNYTIIEKNFLRPWGELDIISKSSDKTLVFVEVKTIKYSRDLSAEEHLNFSKLKKLRKTASLYAGSNQKLIKDDEGWRIDLIAITITNLTDNKKDFILKHYQNI